MTDYVLTPALRVYRRVLALLLPRRFRERFSHQMLAVFAELEAEARQRAGRRGVAAALLSELPGLVRLAARERRAERAERSHMPNAALRKGTVLDSLSQDIRFAARSLRRSPGFTLVATLTLALGIGANTAIFSLVDGVLLRPLPVRDPARLVAVGEQSASAGPGDVSVTSPANLYDWQRSTRSVRIAGFASVSGTVMVRGEPQLLLGTQSIGGVLPLLGVPPVLGRLITDADEDAAAPGTVVLSYESWRDIFGSDRGAIGKSITMNGTPRTVVGVMPPAFSFLGGRSAFYVPARFDAKFRENRDQYFIEVVGRLQSGSSIEQARAELETVAARLRRDWPTFNTNLKILVLPLQETIVGGSRTQLMVLMGAVAFVLLITCANLGNLLLARASGRRREIAVRQALGAGQGRVARQLLTESLLLAFVGGGLGVVVGKLFLDLLLAAQTITNLPRSDEIALDGRVLAFTFGVSLIAGVVFGSVPAWQLARAPSTSALREGTKGSDNQQWARSVLVVTEIALAMVLLTGAGLLLRSFALLQRVDPGVRADHLLTFTVRLPRSDETFFPRSIERMRALPGVRSAALVSQLPVSGRGIGAWFNRIDRPLPAGTNPTGEAYRVVTPGYFETMGISLRRGRAIATTDTRDAPVVVVNEALVRKYYRGEDPLGKRIYLGAPDNRLFHEGSIVGVVSDTRDAGLGRDPLPTVYIPFAVMPGWPAFSYVLRTQQEPGAIIASARRTIRELDPTLPVRDVASMDDVLSTAVAPARWSTTLLGVFAGVALVIAVLGVFGVLSFVVTQRTRELGIRIALGAAPAQVRRLVVGRGVVLVLTGVAAGIVGAMVLTRFMGSLLFGVGATDPITYAAVAAILVGAALLASYLPARRATRVDPILALRAE
ncbi:MAG TPA: ABC transporter permease [Gemmatimonadaceae bacterium]|nr:ABC transporter permease [Gemmatimonadaceae bacterium]